VVFRVLWGSPLPPVRSGVSDYALELLPDLASLGRVRVLAPPGWRDEAAIADTLGAPIVPEHTRPADGEIALLHLGNNPYHAWLLEHLEDAPRVIVLHDLVLHHLLVETTLAEGDADRYESLLRRAHGAAGEALARARRLGYTARRDPFLFPARKPFLEGAAGAVVHSAWAARQVRRDRPDLPVLQLPMPARDPGDGIDRDLLRRKLGAGPDDLLIMHLGFLTPAKGLETILAALAVFAAGGGNPRLVLVGEGGELAAVRAAAGTLGVADRVQSVGWVPYEELLVLPAAADLGVVLRSPSAGETSAAVLRFLACGTPVVVNGLDQFLEWPPDAVDRVTPGPSRVADLVRVLARTAGRRASGRPDPRRRAARRAYVEGRHTPAGAARVLAGFLESLGR